jgi:hypothetical protein
MYNITFCGINPKRRAQDIPNRENCKMDVASGYGYD